MLELTKCSIELYDWWQRHEVLSHRLGIVLFHALRGGPADMGPALERLLADAATFLKRPQSRYAWWNGCDVAAYLIARKTRVSRNTWLSDQATMNSLCAVLGTYPVADITVEHLDDYWVTQENLAASSRNLRLAKLRHFFGWCQDRGWIGSNPAAERNRFREVQHERTIVPQEQFGDLLASARTPQDRIVVAIGLYLFLRASEIRTLRVGDYDRDGHRIRTFQHKTGGLDWMPVCAELVEELDRWLDWYAQHLGHRPYVTDYLVPVVRQVRVRSVAGTFIPVATATWRINPNKPMATPHRAVQRSLALMGLDPYRQGGHTLRRSGARALFDELRGTDGVDGALQQVKVMLHHRSATMTEQYLGVDPERTRRDNRLAGKPMFSRSVGGVADVIEMRR